MKNILQRIIFTSILIDGLILGLIWAAGCNSTADKPVIVSKSLTLEEARIEMEEKGAVFASSLEQASELVGFRVIAPEYIPEDFGFLHIDVNKSGAGTGASVRPVSVSLYYTQRKDFRLPEQSWFLLVQAEYDSSGPGDKLIEICGKKVEQKFDTDLNRLTLSWQDNSTYYSLTGTLNDLLSEDTMKDIICSISRK